MEKIYHVDLTPKQRKYLRKIVRVGTNKAKVISRAHILLKSNEGKTDKEIADLLYIDEETVRCTRQRFWNEGMEMALNGNPYPPPEPKLTDEQEAYLIALACSDPPEGFARWTIDLLTERMIADRIVMSISRDKVRLTLKKQAETMVNKKLVHCYDYVPFHQPNGGDSGIVSTRIQSKTSYGLFR